MTMASRAASSLPDRARHVLRRGVLRARHSGPYGSAERVIETVRTRTRGARRHCPVCERDSHSFKPYGHKRRAEVRCPFCGSFERHRLTWLFFRRRTNLFEPPRKRMLHVAPEPFFAERLARTKEIDYLSGDLHNPRAMVSLDVTDLPFADDTFDVVYCSHVLEHVPDDRAALRELRRVLRPTGWAAIQVPITVATTREDPSVIDPLERERLFGQADHVRRYGSDFRDRLAEAGFQVEPVKATEIASREEIERMALRRRHVIFLCRKLG